MNQINSYLNRNARQAGLPIKATSVPFFVENQQPTPVIQMESLPAAFCCPLSQKIMVDPVIYKQDGQTYEREEALKKFNSSELIANRNIQRLIAKFLKQNSSLFDEDVIYSSSSLREQLLKSVKNGDVTTFSQLVQLNRGFLDRPISNGLTLLQLACQQKEPKILSNTIQLLGRLFWDQIGEDGGLELFRQSVQYLGIEGAQVIANKLEWNEKVFQNELLLAIQSDNLDVVKACLNLGAKPDVKNFDGFYPIHLAVIHQKFEILRELLDRCSNTELVDREGNTALHLAAKSENKKLIKLLLKYGASTKKSKNLKGQRAVDIAREIGHEDIAVYIKAKHQKIKMALFFKPFKNEMELLKKENEQLKKENQEFKIELSRR